MNHDNPIRSLLHIAADGTIANRKITINDITLQSIDARNVIPGIIRHAFNNNPIEITDAQANPVSEGTAIVITGNGAFNLSAGKAPVTLTLTLVDGNVQALFQFTVIGSTRPAKAWKFSDSFPKLPTVLDVSQPDAEPTSPLDDLVMTNAQFLVTTRAQTVDGQDLIAGINFRADLSPSGILSVFETLIGRSGDLKLQGTIALPDDSIITPLKPGEFPWELKGTVPGINLKAGLTEGPFALGGMSFTADHFRLYSAVSKDWFGKNHTFTTAVAYTGTFKIPSAKSAIGVTVLTPPRTNVAQLTANFENSPLGHFSELADILGINNVLSLFPDAIQTGDLGGLGIQRASVTIGFNKQPDVLAASISIGMPRLNWNIWTGHFEVRSASATIDVQNPFNAATRIVNILVQGSIKIEGMPVNISAQRKTGFTIMASVAEGFNVPLTSFMETYIPGIPAVSDLSIDAIELAVSPGNYYSVMLQMAQQPKPWTIPLGVTELIFSNVNMFLLKPASGNFTGTFYGTAQIAGVPLTANYRFPGEVVVKGDFLSVSLSEIVSFFIQQKMDVPEGFDLTFSKSYIMLLKKGSKYRMELGTVIDNIGSLAFVLENGGSGWGVAAGLQIKIDQLGNLSGGVAGIVDGFASWFPFRTFTLAMSTLKDKSFTFPGFEQFKQQGLGKSTIKLPAIAQGIQPGYFLYTSTVFTKKNKVLGALIDLLKVPEGTQLDGYLEYLTEKKQFQLGIAVSTFLTPVGDVSQRTCSGALGYKNSCLTGTLKVLTGGSDKFAFALAASLKTTLEGNELDFDVILKVVANGVFASGTMKVQKPLTFGPLQLGGLALELGVSFEGLPSFGFASQLMVDDLFDSTLAVMINSVNPSESMIAGALSNITLGDVVDKLVGVTNEKLPAPLKAALDEVAIKGTTAGAFTVPKGESATQLETALNDFKGEVIQRDFIKYGKQASFPGTSDGMMIFNDSKHGKWYITEQAGAGSSSTVTHWQLVKNKKQEIEVSKEAQFYFVPSASGVSIGTFHYPQGMKISGRLQFLLFKLDTDIEIVLNKGIRAKAQMDKISLVNDNFFSIAAAEGTGGPHVSISTFTQPSAPEKFQKPHFYVNGKLTILGSSQGVFVDINESGANFEVTGSSLGGIFKGKLNGSFTAEKLSVTGNINIGIGSIDFGKLGTWNIDTGVYAAANIYADVEKETVGASFTAGFEFAGSKNSLGVLSLDAKVGKLTGLPAKCWQAVKDFLWELFKNAAYWAEMAAKVLGWAADKISEVLKDFFKLLPEEVRAIVSAISAFCPIITAVSILGN